MFLQAFTETYMSFLKTLTVYAVRHENSTGTQFTKLIPAESLEEAIGIFRKAYPKRVGHTVMSVMTTDSKVHVL